MELIGQSERTVWITAAVLLSLGAGGSRADYAPLKAGNSWVYEGSFSIRDGNRYFAEVEARERLSVEVLSRQVVGDTALFRVRMRDSLYARKWQAYGAALQDQADTLLSQVVTYASIGDSVFRVPPAADSGRLSDSIERAFRNWRFSLFETTRFFAAHRALPGNPTPVPGADPRTPILDARTFKPDPDYSGNWEDWYTDGIGSIYEHFHGYAGNCGPEVDRSLYLTRFNGRDAVFPVNPPGKPMAKAAKSACSLARGRSATMHAVFPRNGMLRETDVAGRSVRVR